MSETWGERVAVDSTDDPSSRDDDELTLDDIGVEQPDDIDDDADAGKRKGFFGRHKVFTGFLTLVVLLVGSVVGFGFYLNSKLSNVETYVSQINPTDRVPRYDSPTASGPPALNFLFMGADNSSTTSIANQLAKGKWDKGSMRSDTMMLVHIPSDRSSVYVVSLPRDSWVPVPGYGTDKINAAFSYGGPDLAVQTVEQLTKVHIDHVVMIDWNGFKDLTTALGGVPVSVPGEGVQKLQGQEALDYVRTRKTLPNGDFDRIKRQQNFLRQVMKQTFDSVSITNIGMLTDILSIFTGNTTVDAEFTPSVMRDLAWEMRAVKSSNITFMTVPYSGTGMVGGQSVVNLDSAQCALLFSAIRKDEMQKYVYQYKPQQLGNPDQIN